MRREPDDLVRVRYKEFQEARIIISYLSYYWEVWGKNHGEINARFSRLMQEFYRDSLEDVYEVITCGRLSRTVKLTIKQLNTLEQLVMLTNTLERISEQKRSSDDDPTRSSTDGESSAIPITR